MRRIFVGENDELIHNFSNNDLDLFVILHQKSSFVHSRAHMRMRKSSTHYKLIASSPPGLFQVFRWCKSTDLNCESREREQVHKTPRILSINFYLLLCHGTRPQNMFYPCRKKNDKFNRGWELVEWIDFIAAVSEFSFSWLILFIVIVIWSCIPSVVRAPIRFFNSKTRRSSISPYAKTVRTQS